MKRKEDGHRFRWPSFQQNAFEIYAIAASDLPSPPGLFIDRVRKLGKPFIGFLLFFKRLSLKRYRFASPGSCAAHTPERNHWRLTAIAWTKTLPPF